MAEEVLVSVADDKKFIVRVCVVFIAFTVVSVVVKRFAVAIACVL